MTRDFFPLVLKLPVYSQHSYMVVLFKTYQDVYDMSTDKANNKCANNANYKTGVLKGERHGQHARSQGRL